MARQFGDVFPAWPLPQRWLIAVLLTVLFFMSVLAHELSHSLVAVHKGIPVHGITLFIFGGVSQLAHEARKPFTEFIVAIVGPLTSVLLGGFFLLLLLTVAGNAPSTEVLFTYLSVINFAIAAFNMLPGFPLDGGRVLRSVVWGITGSYWRATQVAARGGQTIGGIMILTGLGGVLFRWAAIGQIQGIWLVLIGGFLFFAATTSYRQERVRESLRLYRVADVTTTDWFTLPGETPLTSPLVAQGLNGRDDFVGVLVSGEMEGIVTRRRLSQVPINAWPYTRLSQVMIPLQSIPMTDAGEAIFDALEGMEANHLDRMAVVNNGVLLGFINLANAQRFVRALQPSKLRI
jgi:Zn-dependent protease